ncbi:SusD/RagB family nutrient-binding outer membrane lipoprotein [Flavihumibacter petaseus]|uniref:SusD/RagB family protein n=1 Tax=Flavihumibacter petaseus NBRC 106054 TaxID=1220578 RepID=A0A0E9MVL4_9BACT|nr:SusD/RagB family nutrient-binding outer membrane lipoprotein [Flavihumibacter petaseus]GAO41170.1 hypothetical protein FPE01S_01_01820 [Flavihumibacter petaseus NBRC 106054]
MKRANKLYKYFLLGAAITFIAASCKKEAFVEENISPTTIYELKPEDQFLRASTSVVNDFEYYYDVYRRLNGWLQYTTEAAGNGSGFTEPGAQFNYRYGRFFGDVGYAVVDALKIIESLPEDQKASYTNIKAISEILFAYYGFYVSDINGSIPFSEAFQARYGGTLTPVYDDQQAIFSQADALIKGAVAALEANAGDQVALGRNDPFFGGDVTRWIRTGNALRLKIALRLMKADPGTLTTIANEVLADPMQMESIADSWMLKVGPTFADAGGNFNPTGFAAGRPVLEFMKENEDPRLRMFYRTNKDGEYVGSFTSPDDAQLAANRPLYSTPDTLSQLQHRMFTPNYAYNGGDPGKGTGFYPLLTYAEYCFIRADLAARNIAGSDAETWYKNGVYASIDLYNQQARLAEVPDYVPVTEGEKDAYYAKADVKFDAAKATELIAVQAYLDFFRNPFEGWAWWKRTGFPNSTSVLPWTVLKSNGAVLPLARRASLQILPTTSLLYENQAAAYSEMAQDPNFGQTPSDAFGRVWWDKP